MPDTLLKLELSQEQLTFIVLAEYEAEKIVQNAYEVNQRRAEEVFTASPQQRQCVIAHKLLEYVIQTDGTGRELANRQTILDALLDMAPSAYNHGSRRQRKAKVALEQWFGESTDERRLIGSSLLSIIDHHERRTAQKSGELRHQEHLQDGDGPKLVHVTKDGLELFQLSTKKHLEQESAVLEHCLGTGTLYAEQMLKGRRIFFSLRNPKSHNQASLAQPFTYTSFEYDTTEHTVKQIRGFKNTAVRIDSPHIKSVVESLAFIREHVEYKGKKDFRVKDLIDDTVRVFEIGDIPNLAMSIPDDIEGLADFLMPTVDIVVPENYEGIVPDDISEKLQALKVRNFTFDSTSPSLLAQILEQMNHLSGDVVFSRLKIAEGLEALETIQGSAHFPALVSSTGLENLKSIGKDAIFPVLTDAKGLRALESIGKQAYFKQLKDSTGLEALVRIGGSAYFHELTDAQGLNSLTTIGGRAYFDTLANAGGLENLHHVGGRLYANTLTGLDGLNRLTSVGWAYVRSMRHADRIKIRTLQKTKR